ncbi:MAG: peptidylprolyl isomerase [Bryobacteraceae bacterium]|nr:peptidylprolyl isomerase [Bryobacteraceae bacterium]
MPWYVNGEMVDDTAVRDEARMMRPRYQEAFADMDPIEAEMQLKEWSRENVIERMLLRQTAATDPEPVPAEFLEEALESARNDAGGVVGCGTRTSDDEIRAQADIEFRMQRLLQRVQSAINAPPEKEIAAWYKKSREQFKTPELCWARHVVKNVDEGTDEEAARAAIEQAAADIGNGVPFEEVADKFSDCAGNGGDLGWFPKGEMVEEFEEQVFELPVGGTTGVFRSVFGFHIARVLGRKPAGVRPLEDVRGEIVDVLMQERRQKALEEYLDKVRAGADIKQVKATA